MKYEKAIELLTSQAKFQIKPGLERIGQVLKLLGNPQNKIKIIHIAGTNGKGSVCSALANILKCSGYKTGLYTSPHLIEYTERIKINSEDITKDSFANYTEQICNIADKNQIDLTEFEILTAAAFKYFYDEKVDIAIIETGMGGRFDATNTEENPIISIITSISFDHTDRLGDTIEKIAFEKAGIIKPNSNVIIAKDNKGFEVIKNFALRQNSKITQTPENIKTVFKDGKNYILYRDDEYEFSLLGTYQNKNMTLVFAAVEFLQKNGFNIKSADIKNGLKTLKWGARLQFIKGKNLIIDGAHNPDAAFELKKSLDYYFPGQKRTYIYSTLDTKNYTAIAKTLFRENDIVYYIEFEHKNAVKFEEYVKKVNWINVKKIDNTKINDILKEQSLKIVCGSLYMIGQFYNSLTNNNDI